MDSKSQGFKCSKDTLHNYLSYLEDASCFSFVPIFSESVRKQHVHYRKIYAVDHGLVTAFSQSTTINSGRLLETMVYNQLRRNFKKSRYVTTKQKIIVKSILSPLKMALLHNSFKFVKHFRLQNPVQEKFKHSIVPWKNFPSIEPQLSHEMNVLHFARQINQLTLYHFGHGVSKMHN